MSGKWQAGRTPYFLGLWTVLAAACFTARVWIPKLAILPSGATWLDLAGTVAGILALSNLFTLLTIWLFEYQDKPPVEGIMVGRLYRLAAILAIFVYAAYGFGRLETFGTLFATFGGMLMGWSLQAPVSGLAAWALVSLKRPFRPGDRVQFPNLGLTGDVKDIGLMYTVLDQVGGTIGSEEAVGRYILVPNAMLFSQVAINYTVTQKEPYFLDEVVVRITFDSDWESAEKILLNAATDLTREIIATTGVQPYIRSDLYDYGVYLRLRYQTPVKDRAEIAYQLTKRIFVEIQRTPQVDLAIPFVYSARAGAHAMAAAERKEEESVSQEGGSLQEIPIDQIVNNQPPPPPDVIKQLGLSIAAQGLLQPIVVIRTPDQQGYEVLAGQQRLEACKRLGWRIIPALVKGTRPQVPAATDK